MWKLRTKDYNVRYNKTQTHLLFLPANLSKLNLSAGITIASFENSSTSCNLTVSLLSFPLPHGQLFLRSPGAYPGIV